jgi:ketosteroid isomerase-like protein
MSEAENVEVIRGFYEAMNRGDWEAVFENASPEIEWEKDPRHPRAGVYRGQALEAAGLSERDAQQ